MEPTKATRLAIAAYANKGRAPIALQLMNSSQSDLNPLIDFMRDLWTASDGEILELEVIGMRVSDLSRGLTLAFRAMEYLGLNERWPLVASEVPVERRIVETFPVRVTTHPGRFSADIHPDHEGL